MPLLSPSAHYVIAHPAAFARRVLDDFRRNQCLLQAGAIAYYALLSVVPMLILVAIVLSHLVDQAELFAALGGYLEWLVPSQSRAVLADVSGFLDNRAAIGAVLLATMLFFSSLAFSALEKALGVIFTHRRESHARHALVAAVLPYSFVLLLGTALLGLTVVSVGVQSLADESIRFLGREWSLSGLSGLLLYLLGFAAEVAILAAFYLVLPVGRTRLRHALVGALTAALAWEAVRHLLIWYFTHLSKASVVYGSLTTAVVALFSMEIAAILFLLGAQVISEYERVGEDVDK